MLRAFSIYFTSHGIQAEPPTSDPGKGYRPIGALALAATAVSDIDPNFVANSYPTSFQVERGYRMHITGDYLSGGSDFSSSKCLPTTDFYLDKIQNDLTSNDWTSIFQALHYLQESDARNEQIQIGGPLVPAQREPLLPADPPTPPAMD